MTTKLKNIGSLTFRDMVENLDLYSGLADGLVELPCPSKISVWYLKYKVPQTVGELTENICYGQRLYLMREDENYIQCILRMLSGFYYPIAKRKQWNEDKAEKFKKNIFASKVIEAYPVASHFNNLLKEVIEREKKLLHREPSKVEKAAGIEKLNVFSELNSIDFLRDAMKIPVEEVLLTPYNECLVRFMNAKEVADFNERYFKLLHKENEPKKKFK